MIKSNWAGITQYRVLGSWYLSDLDLVNFLPGPELNRLYRRRVRVKLSEPCVCGYLCLNMDAGSSRFLDSSGRLRPPTSVDCR